MGYIIRFPSESGYIFDYYFGKTFINAGEKYACYCDLKNSKVFKSKNVAEKHLEKLRNSCENVGDNANVVEVETYCNIPIKILT